MAWSVARVANQEHGLRAWIVTSSDVGDAPTFDFADDLPETIWGVVPPRWVLVCTSLTSGAAEALPYLVTKSVAGAPASLGIGKVAAKAGSWIVALMQLMPPLIGGAP